MSSPNTQAIVDRLVQKGKELLERPATPWEWTDNPGANKLIGDLAGHPHAFVLACIMDRQMKTEKAVLVPHLIAEKIGGFDFPRLEGLRQEDIREMMAGPPPLHRFPDKMSRNFYEAIQLISKTYVGDASRIWADRPSSADVVRRFLEFRGVGPKIATMAANSLVHQFKVPLADYAAIEISADVHVCRVFERLGLVDPPATPERVVITARSLHPEYAGIMDLPAWEIGHQWCKPETPLCAQCYMSDHCPWPTGRQGVLTPEESPELRAEHRIRYAIGTPDCKQFIGRIESWGTLVNGLSRAYTANSEADAQPHLERFSKQYGPLIIVPVQRRLKGGPWDFELAFPDHHT